MGMSDAQFDSYKMRLLRELERAQADLTSINAKSDILDQLIADLRNELQKP